MKSIEKSVFGSFLVMCVFDSDVFWELNDTKPYLREKGLRKDVDIIKITPCGTTERGNPIFCYELLWR